MTQAIRSSAGATGETAPSGPDDAPVTVARAFPAVGPDGPLAGVALLTIDRPRALNALDFATIASLVEHLEALDGDPDCRAIVITGAGERAFAAGADIRELAVQTPTTLTTGNHFGQWERIAAIRTPLIAAVRGAALGGGCELAMTCDLIVAADDATFGQPEIKLGVMPGAGGTQRLTRAIGKARAMELILTGRSMTAAEALAAGLVTRLAPAADVLADALGLGAEIAAMPPVAVRAAKEAILRAAELPLSTGLEFERRNFFLLFDTDDMREGTAAFLEKRPPAWKGR